MLYSPMLFKLLLLILNTASASYCDIYNQKAAELSCLPSNYLTRFGDHYCRIYESNHSSFSPHGQRVTARIRSCLAGYIESTPDLTCENVEDKAVLSHISCYVNNGFCELKESDKWIIFLTARHEMFNPKLIDAMNEIYRLCYPNLAPHDF